MSPRRKQQIGKRNPFWVYKKREKKKKEGKRSTLGMVTLDVVLEDGRTSRINLLNCVASIELNTPYVALFNAIVEVGRDAGV